MLFNLRESGDAEALLKASESRLPEYIFWLDLNRLSAEALLRLGERFDKAHEAVCQETAFLVHRLPGLADLSFSDGTPFANSDTIKWLKETAFEAEEGAEKITAEIPEAESGINQRIKELKQLIRKGKVIEAIENAQRDIAAVTSKKEQLLWKLSMAEMLQEAGKERLAVPYAEQVLKNIEEYRLEQYDPRLAIKGLKTAFTIFDNGDEGKKETILNRIGQLDMTEMLKLMK
jgi:type VI secretion system protein VasJ